MKTTTMTFYLYYDGFRFFATPDNFFCDLVDSTEVCIPNELTVEMGQYTWLVTHNASGEVYSLRDVISRNQNGDLYIDMYPYGRYKLKKIRMK